MRTFATGVLLALLLPACSSQPAPDVGLTRGSGSAELAPSPAAASSDSEATTAPTPSATPPVSGAAAPPSDDPEVEGEQQAARTRPTPAASGGTDTRPQVATATDPPPSNDTSVASSPAEPGSYTYATDGSTTMTGGTPHPLPDTTSLDAEAPSDGRQRTVRDLRDEDGRGQVTETTLIYDEAGVFVSHVKVTSDMGGGIRNVREWQVEPPGLLAPAGAEPGDHSHFTMRSTDTTARVSVEFVRREILEVAGVSVETIVTSIDIVVSGAIEGKQTTTAWVRPSDFLTVKEQVQSDFSSGALRVRTSYQAELDRLAPS